MIQIIYYILFSITLIYGLFFLITGFWGFARGKKRIKEYKPKNRFAILIAARNESKVIGNLVLSLKEQDYPKDKYEIYVIANNCTDNTAEVAKKAGATILPCEVPVKTKGDVLKHTFAKFVDDKNVDAFIIFDADNVVDPNFLKEMNNTICSGYNVAEGNRDSKNTTDNWLSGSYSLFYYMQNFFFNKARMNMNLSASINGTGFMVKREVIKKHGFDPKTLTEDIEFTAMCALNQEKIAFVSKAITYDEQPIKFKDSWKQRKRWSKGMLQCLKIYDGPLLRFFFKTGSMPALDIALVFMAPVMQLLGTALLIILVIFKFCGIELFDIFSYLFAYGLLFFVITYIIGILLNMFIFKINKQKIKDVFASILLFSVFIITWIPINIICVFKRDITWEPITHNRNINVETLNIKK